MANFWGSFSLSVPPSLLQCSVPVVFRALTALCSSKVVVGQHGWVRPPTSQPDGLHCTSRGFTQSCLLITYSTMPYSGSTIPHHHQPPPATTTIRQVIGSIKEGQIRPLGFNPIVSSLSNVCYWIGSYSSFFLLLTWY